MRSSPLEIRTSSSVVTGVVLKGRLVTLAEYDGIDSTGPFPKLKDDEGSISGRTVPTNRSTQKGRPMYLISHLWLVHDLL